jgi:uncharacterized protein
MCPAESLRSTGAWVCMTIGGMTAATPLEVAERLFSSIMRGDVDGVRDCYAPGIEVWHNNDGKVEDAATNLRTLTWVTQNIKDLRYEDIRRQETPSGFVQQHVLRGIAPNGKALELPACIVCTVVEGKITRLDEYLDSAHTAVLRS